MVGKTLGWIFGRLPVTDDPEVRKRVVYAIIMLNFFLLVALTAAVLYVQSGRRYEHNLCESQKAGRVQQQNRNAVIRRYLVQHGAPQIAAKIVDSPLLDCKTGLAR